MKNPKRKLLLLALCATFLAGSSWAAVIGPVAASAFTDTVNWCQFGCPDPSTGTLITPVALATSQPWTSVGGATGTVSLLPPASGTPYMLQESGNWVGNFAPQMGLITNYACCGGPSSDILVGFDAPQFSVGAYIQSDSPGPFTATILLYGADLSTLLGSFTMDGFSDSSEGGALFIGALSSDLSQPVFFAQFTVSNTTNLAGPEPDFAIGSLSFTPAAFCGDSENSENDDCLGTIPEPASLLLMAPALLGLVALTRRRASARPRG